MKIFKAVVANQLINEFEGSEFGDAIDCIATYMEGSGWNPEAPETHFFTANLGAVIKPLKAIEDEESVTKLETLMNFLIANGVDVIIFG